jgi:hypothetical protein
MKNAKFFRRKSAKIAKIGDHIDPWSRLYELVSDSNLSTKYGNKVF